MTDIKKQLEIARQSLLDLTMRNRLINFRPSKSSTIKIIDEIAREVYDILVLHEKAMSFLPKKDKVGEINNANQNTIELQTQNDLSKDEKAILWDFPAEEQLGSHHTDNYLQTNLDREALQRKLFRINQQAKSALEEQGYTILYLALGFIEWFENADALESRKAPLILIPVELQRMSVKSAFKLVWTGEDITTNISLKAILANQDINFPEFEIPEDKTGIDIYIKNVITSISNFPKWKVLNDIHLGFFSFTKFVMYKDLDSNVWPDDSKPCDHVLLKTLFGFDSENNSDNFEYPEISEDIDSKIAPQDVFHVMDADSSQILVIEDAKKGSNLVVEGPPGTGKSQTITNMIAELLAKGKNVLFVSEKMAALEVVKSRLNQVGVGAFCLELHSRKSNKKDVLDELEKAIFNTYAKFPSASDEYHQLHELRNELNEYAKALREPFHKTGFSPFDFYSLREKVINYFDRTGRSAPRISGMNECTKEEYLNAKRKLQELGEILPFVGLPKTSPWRGCKIDTVLPSDQEEIVETLNFLEKALLELRQITEKLSDLFQLKPPANQTELVKASSAVKIILESSPTDKNVLLNPEWNQPNVQAQRLIDMLEEFAEVSSRIISKVKENVLAEPIQEIFKEFKKYSQSCWRFFNLKYRRLVKKVRSFYQNKPPKKLLEIVYDLEQLSAYCRLKKELAEEENVGKALFGSFWNGEKSDREKLKSFSDWIVAFRRELLHGLLTENSVQIINQKNTNQLLKEVVRTFEIAVKNFETTYFNLTQKLVLDSAIAFSGKESAEVKFSELLERCKSWSSEIHTLSKWAQYNQRRNECLKTIANPVCAFLETNEVNPKDILPALEANYSESLLKIAFLERKSLSKFDGDLHLRKVQKFVELDQQLVVKNRHRLINKLYEERPKISNHSSAGSEAGILIGEFSKKRRHMPIRKLLLEAGHLIQKIKPCFMMSPLSVAQFLDPKSIQFDVIIFDEASQVKPQDALGAFLRGKQLVVMGDTKQLPPTSFFDHMVESDEDETELSAVVSDIESILHLCKGRFPSKMLRWHYRSKHESLIAVSNQEFYENHLFIYPSAIDTADHSGLSFVHLPEAVYDRGKSSVNRKEAKIVAEAALKHYQEFPDRSLGIGTFNIKQQEAILEEIELQLRLNPEMENHFSSNKAEHFFVKNLETIQGDERDVIFLSIGYGFDEGRKLSRNFGPLNQEGGHRRLNVLITRAREKCVVFSNFRAIDLSLDENAPFGLRALKVFLDYAETRNLRSATTSCEDTDSPFEDAVYEFLTGKGHQVRKQVGCASFRVDLAVVDEKYPGRYLVGVECDGAKYHNSPVARDRDRLRQQILESLGWQIHRIWSTDWYRNRKEVEKRLLEVVEQLKRAERDFGSRSKKGTVDSKPEDAVPDSQSRNQKERVEETEKAPLYQICKSLASYDGGLHEQTPAKLAEAVTKVVEVEGPVHFDEVVRRIRTLWGLKRSGGRIEEAIRRGVECAEEKGSVKNKKDFLWPSIDRPLIVRRREEDPLPKIELICDEEIGEAAKWVLKQQFATKLDDLVIEASRVLGFQATRSETFERIKTIILKHIEDNSLVQKANGMIGLASVE